jgi:ABC-type antimicrobial peptide transport system permease subunit
MDVSAYKQPGALPAHLKENYEEIELASHVQEGEFKLSYNDKGFFERGYTIEPDFISIFPLPIIKGNPDKLFTDPNSIVLTSSLGKKIFGNEDPMGKMITFNDHQSFAVTGIVEDLPGNTHLDFEFLIRFNPNHEWNSWKYKNGESYVLLADQADLSALNDKIYNLLDNFQPDWNNKLFLHPLVKDHLYPIRGPGAITFIYIFSSIAAIILLIACINFMNLTTAQAEKRLNEIGVKKVSGSTRSQLAIQFFTESFIMVALSAGIAILLVELLIPIINLQLGLNIDPQFTSKMAVSVGLVILVSGLISGSYPAMLLSSLRPQSVFKSGSGKSGSYVWVRRVLVTTQFTLSILFIIGVLTIQKQMDFLRNKHLGYDKENLMLIQSHGEMRNKLPVIKQKLLDQQLVSTATVSANNLFFITNSGPLDYPGKPVGEGAEFIEFWYNWVDEDFIKTLNIDLITGRFFSKPANPEQQNYFVVNETAVKKMELEDPLGQTIKPWFGEQGTIIGVIKDYHINSLHNEIPPMVLSYADKNNFLLVRLKKGELPQSVKLVGETIHEIVPDDPYNYHFVDESIEQQYQIERRSSNLMKLSAILAVFISSLGLFSLAAYTIEKRTKEIGIRKVNGASIKAVIFLLNKEFLTLVAISFIIACPIAWYILDKWLNAFVYKTGMTWGIFALAGGLALSIALITVSYQSIKAAVRNPVEALRYE